MPYAPVVKSLRKMISIAASMFLYPKPFGGGLYKLRIQLTR
jgi:hypothetical protein